MVILLDLPVPLSTSGDVQDSVGIKVEGDLDLGDTTGSRGDTGELELAEQVVVLGACTLTLEDLDQDTGLVVGEGGEDLGLLGGDGGVALMSVVMTPPAVSIPRDRGVTSSRRISLVDLDACHQRG